MKNATLKNCFKLASKVTIYVPATVNTNEAIDNTFHVDKTAKMLSSCFGGATSSKAVGYWVSDQAGLVKENTTIVFAYCTTDQLENNIDEVVEWCMGLKAEMAQEAIALEINGEMYFI